MKGKRRGNELYLIQALVAVYQFSAKVSFNLLGEGLSWSLSVEVCRVLREDECELSEVLEMLLVRYLVKYRHEIILCCVTCKVFSLVST